MMPDEYSLCLLSELTLTLQGKDRGLNSHWGSACPKYTANTVSHLKQWVIWFHVTLHTESEVGQLADRVWSNTYWQICVGMSFCSEVKLAVWVGTGSTKHRHSCCWCQKHPLQHTHTHIHTCATYPDESFGSVADHFVTPLEALLRAIVAINRIRSQQEAYQCVLYSMLCIVLCLGTYTHILHTYCRCLCLLMFHIWNECGYEYSASLKVFNKICNIHTVAGSS